MSVTNPIPTQQETLEPCWCREDIEYLRVKPHMDHGEFGCRERARYVYCPNCWACGPAYATDEKAIEGWNKSRRAAVAGPRGDVRELGIDTNFPLSETLRLLVEWTQHLHVSHECDCDGWEQRSFLIEAAQGYQREIVQAAATSSPTPAESDVAPSDVDQLLFRLTAKDCERLAAGGNDCTEDLSFVEWCVVCQARGLLQKYSRAAPADNDAESLLQHVAYSGVEFDDNRMGYVVVQIDRDVWEQVKKLAPTTTTKGDR